MLIRGFTFPGMDKQAADPTKGYKIPHYNPTQLLADFYAADYISTFNINHLPKGVDPEAVKAIQALKPKLQKELSEHLQAVLGYNVLREAKYAMSNTVIGYKNPQIMAYVAEGIYGATIDANFDESVYTRGWAEFVSYFTEFAQRYAKKLEIALKPKRILPGEPDVKVYYPTTKNSPENVYVSPSGQKTENIKTHDLTQIIQDYGLEYAKKTFGEDLVNEWLQQQEAFENPPHDPGNYNMDLFAGQPGYEWQKGKFHQYKTETPDYEAIYFEVSKEFPIPDNKIVTKFLKHSYEMKNTLIYDANDHVIDIDDDLDSLQTAWDEWVDSVKENAASPSKQNLSPHNYLYHNVVNKYWAGGRQYDDEDERIRGGDRWDTWSNTSVGNADLQKVIKDRANVIKAADKVAPYAYQAFRNGYWSYYDKVYKQWLDKKEEAQKRGEKFTEPVPTNSQGEPLSQDNLGNGYGGLNWADITSAYMALRENPMSLQALDHAIDVVHNTGGTYKKFGISNSKLQLENILDVKTYMGGEYLPDKEKLKRRDMSGKASRRYDVGDYVDPKDLTDYMSNNFKNEFLRITEYDTSGASKMDDNRKMLRRKDLSNEFIDPEGLQYYQQMGGKASLQHFLQWKKARGEHYVKVLAHYVTYLRVKQGQMQRRVIACGKPMHKLSMR